MTLAPGAVVRLDRPMSRDAALSPSLFASAFQVPSRARLLVLAVVTHGGFLGEDDVAMVAHGRRVGWLWCGLLKQEVEE